MAVLASGVGRLYGSKDESNGRVNPALEPDYDMDPRYPMASNALAHDSKYLPSGHTSSQVQNNTAF